MFVFSSVHVHVWVCIYVLMHACLWLFVRPRCLADLPACCVCMYVFMRVCVCVCVCLLPGEQGFLCSVISAELAEAGRKLHSPPPARKDLLQSRAPLAKWNQTHTHMLTHICMQTYTLLPITYSLISLILFLNAISRSVNGKKWQFKLKCIVLSEIVEDELMFDVEPFSQISYLLYIASVLCVVCLCACLGVCCWGYVAMVTPESVIGTEVCRTVVMLSVFVFCIYLFFWCASICVSLQIGVWDSDDLFIHHRSYCSL